MNAILESRLESTLRDPEIFIENYEILPFVRNPHGGGVRSDISYKLTSLLPNEIENIIFNILMPHTKPITIGIIYGLPNQSEFLDIFEENLPKVNTSYLISMAISILIFLKMENVFSINPPVITKTLIHSQVS